MKSIMIIDDDTSIGNMLEELLSKEGYHISRAYSGTEGLLMLSIHRPDLILLDLMLPGQTGEEILPQIPDIPVIVLSAKTDIDNKVDLLLNGAADYVTKPFPISVFRKKVSALLGRIQRQTGGDCYTDGTLSINFGELTAALAGDPVIFTPMEYRLLKVLVRNPQTVLTRQALLEKLWDADENFVDEHALTAAISRIRGKIEADGQQYIKTVYGMGYMWIGGIKK